MGCTLHQHSHHHHGSSAHGESGNHSRDDAQNINVRAAYIHVIGDFIQSFGVLVASLVIYFKVNMWSRARIARMKNLFAFIIFPIFFRLDSRMLKSFQEVTTRLTVFFMLFLFISSFFYSQKIEILLCLNTAIV